MYKVYCIQIQDIKRNSLVIDRNILGNLTRHQAFCLRYPSIIQPKEISLLQSKQQNQLQFDNEYNPIPPRSYLCEWKNDIEKYQKSNPGKTAFVKCKLKKQVAYNMEAINDLIRIHKEVQRELDWYAEIVDWPANVEEYPNNQSITHFRSLLYSSRTDEVLADYDMPVGELSKLCCTRWLSSDHICWMTETLNKAQGETYSIYMNYVGNVERFVSRRIVPLQPKPSKYFFILNVGGDDGAVYLGSDSKPGNHWTVCYVDTDRKIIMYGDSIAWQRPEILLDKIAQFVHEIKNESIVSYSFVYAHDPLSMGSSGHRCGSKCIHLYPLQRCSNVCGVVALIISAIACLAPSFFDELIDRGVGQRRTRPSFLEDPTKYSKYLRYVLMSWFADKRVNISHVLSKLPLPPPLITGKLDETHLSNDLRSPCDKIPQDHDQNTEKLFHQRGKPSNDSTPENQDQNHSRPSNLNKKKCKKVEKKFECPYCDLTCGDKSNLKRHIKRKHQTKRGEAGAKNNADSIISLSPENCKCCHCGYSCRRIVELRKHLGECHNVIFRTETITFKHYTGRHIREYYFIISYSQTFRFCAHQYFKSNNPSIRV